MSQSPSPIKPRSPVKFAEDEDFSDIPEYHASTRRPFGAPGQYHGRFGIDEIAQIVGSKHYRNIKRSGNFMPGQFELWNARETGGNGKYYGDFEDADHDGLAHEFVVRRGGADGPMIAVNGYTTGRSDWPARRAFFEAYPNRKDRKGKTAKSYMRDEYYAPERDKYGVVTKWLIEPGSEKDKWRGKQYEQYIRYVPPKKLTPFNAFRAYIGMPAFDKFLDSIGVTRKQFIKQRGVGDMSKIIGNLFYEMVKGPIKAMLHDKGHMEALEQQFIEGKQDNKPGYSADDPNYETDLDNWLFKKADVKKVVKALTRQLLDKVGESITEATARIHEMFEDPSHVIDGSELEI